MRLQTRYLLAPAPIQPESPALPTWQRVLLLSLLIWSFVALMQTVAGVGDQLRDGKDLRLGFIAAKMCVYSLPMAAYCAWLYLRLMHCGGVLIRARELLLPLAWGSICYFVPHTLLSNVVIAHLIGDRPWGELVQSLRQLPVQYAVWDYLLFLGFSGAVYALALVARQLQMVQRQRVIEAENLELHFALEQQRMAALRAQLEPHFMFNALNAISALVRADEKKLAITALSRLSMLLRYALTASDQEWVTLGDEMRFIRDYLELQGLRFGKRLQIRVENDDASLMDVAFPPLLLQPLVENALRHDLERHEQPSEIVLTLTSRGEVLQLSLSNPLREMVPPNPGTGLGLRNARERLRLAFGDAASLTTQATDGRFVVTLQLPLRRHD
ncbi:sensor histidine kinase [Chitinimonas koreensis]|uniref:sensor histidine kinase n=1 Tax=Chitinimonas koreensis TaxID=356302 RepID=UPI0006848F58|nr:histidine kinase [Chitinimonas koreensis]QNM95974.1 histidine kinase [Chitinimonas koreensis]